MPVSARNATLQGSANPNGAAATGWFRYATTDPGTCNDTFGTRAPASGGASLGAVTTDTSFSQGITGLTPATTYYFCALAQSSVGTVLGTVRTFTTAALAEVTTLVATNITSSTARLQGSADPNGAATTGYFRYATTDPGTCNDTFGSRAPSSGGSSLGMGTTPQAFNRDISGLSAGTTYYYCALATSSEGTAFGAVRSFTTSSAPIVTTLPATLVTATTARMNGSAAPNGAATSAWFRYSATSPGACSDSFGIRVPGTSSHDLGSGTSDVPYLSGVSGLTPATTYYYCAVATNSYGTSFGELLSFTTPAAPPTATTSSATSLTGTSARLNGSSNPGGAATTGWFRYGTASPGTCNDSFGTRAPATGGSALGSGASNTSFAQDISGLSPATTYYYCAIVSSSVGTAFGTVLSFKTPAPPTVATFGATSITNTAATLNGSGDPNGAPTTGYFRYSLTHPGTCDDTFGSRAPVSGGTTLGSGDSSVAFAERVTGLSSGTTYYYCAIAQK